jgi:hypothetical protein
MNCGVDVRAMPPGIAVDAQAQFGRAHVVPGAGHT